MRRPIQLPAKIMKLIQCMVRLEKLEEVIDQLAKWTPGLTVAHVQEHGANGRVSVYRGAQYRIIPPRIMIELATDDNKVDDMVRLLIEMGQDGETVEGRISVLPVEQAYHVRTGFMD